MHILVELDGVLRQGEKPIFPGVVLTGTLTAYNKLTIMSATSREDTQRWLDVHGIVDMDDIVDNSVGLESEDLKERQVKSARSRGNIDLLITGDPKLWVFAFEQGIPSVMFGAPEYSRVEFRPDAPKRVRSWNDIEAAIDKQNALRTQDARLTRTDALNFE